MARVFSLIDKEIDLDRSELLMAFDKLDISDWPYVNRAPAWRVENNQMIGGSPDEATYGEIFYKTPFSGDVVLEFDAEILAPSYHDLIWFWNTRLHLGDERAKYPEIWGDGYLGCLGGWYANLAGIERTPAYQPSVIAPSCPVEAGKSYHIVSGCTGHRQFIAVDGKLVTYFTDPNPPDPATPGYIGFGIFESCAAYWNLKVWRPHVVDVPLKYVPGTQWKAGMPWSLHALQK
ncbi:MAG: hypothetical protein MJ033_08040 [Victivallaceae bacterium]|nr:hypothetical protein [Victivallaceae bacterium]